MIAYRYCYDREERAHRSYMLFEFSQGFKEANRSVFIDTYTNYFFSKHHGEEPGAERDPARRSCSRRSTASTTPPAAGAGSRPTSGPGCSRLRSSSSRRRRSARRCKEEVAKFDCPVLTRLVLKPVVRFGYFPRLKLLFFRDFSDVDERIEKAVRSYELAEQAGWPSVAEAIRYQGVLPDRCFADPLAYAASLRQASLPAG